MPKSLPHVASRSAGRIPKRKNRTPAIAISAGEKGSSSTKSKTCGVGDLRITLECLCKAKATGEKSGGKVSL
jgi:hypothetical protein